MTGIDEYVKDVVMNAIEKAEAREFCVRCGEELLVIAYVIRSETFDHGIRPGRYCHDCCPHGCTMECVKVGEPAP